MIRLSLITSCYKGLRYLPDFFEQVQAQTIFPQLEIVLVHNDPTPEELAVVAAFERQHPEHIRHLKVTPVEPLGASWNRGWHAAQGEYVAMWNVDDCRPADGLERQLACLDANSDCVMSYGDFVEVPQYGLTAGAFHETPAYDPRRFSRAFPQGGAFLVWRKTLADQIGYFDEQMLIGPDFEYAVRVAVNGLPMCRASGTIGYFTNAELGLSTRDGSIKAAIERTVIQQRYAIYDKIRPQYLDAAAQFRPDEIQVAGEWLPLVEVFPNVESYRRKRSYLKLFGWLRHILRTTFTKLGLLDLIYRLQERYLKREI
ncbi:MAG: glycosyltransferase family 2 protein [Anaerolineales bacterium]|nr:glycosyltransferase family 2 protein [Anaerolineales bacterium]